MPGRKRRAPAADLSRAIVQFDRWRQGRIARSRIPDRLWQMAVTVAGRHGMARTAAALKLDYYSLKLRLAERRSPVGDTADSIPPAFVELAPGPVPSLGPCVVEFSDGTGFTLRVQLPAGQLPDLVALGHSFRDGR
jgi:hypothetical protein